MMLPIIGGVFALIFILNSLSRAFRRRTGMSFLNLSLALLTIAPLSLHALRGDSTTGLPAQVLLVVGMLLVAGMVILWIERSRAKPGLNASQGIMTLGTSGLLLASVLIDPLIMDTLAKSAKASSAVSQSESTQSVIVSLASTEVLSSPTNTIAKQIAVPILTNTPQPTIDVVPTQAIPNPLPTRFIYTTFVPTATSGQVPICEAVVQHNLNLRAEASSQSTLIVTIPFSTFVPVHGRNDDSTWLYIRYNNQFGWVSAEYVLPKAGCKNLPIQN